MAIALPETVTRLLDGRNFAHLATIMSDGSPHCAPVWVGREGDRIIICTDEDSVKGENTRRDPRVAISSLIWTIPTAKRSFAGGWWSGVAIPISNTLTRSRASTSAKPGPTVRRCRLPW